MVVCYFQVTLLTLVHFINNYTVVVGSDNVLSLFKLVDNLIWNKSVSNMFLI